MTALRKLLSAARMDNAGWALVAEAVVALIAARALSLLPFRVLARRLGGLTPPPRVVPALVPDPTLGEAQQTAIRRVRWAIAAVEAWLPLRTLCLQQAIAARAMLHRRGIGSVLHLGVDQSRPTGLKAHAWLDAGGRHVTGYPVDPALAEVGRFVAASDAPPTSARG